MSQRSSNNIKADDSKQLASKGRGRDQPNSGDARTGGNASHPPHTPAHAYTRRVHHRAHLLQLAFEICDSLIKAALKSPFVWTCHEYRVRQAGLRRGGMFHLGGQGQPGYNSPTRLAGMDMLHITEGPHPVIRTALASPSNRLISHWFGRCYLLNF